jgi:hypothetical protein
VVPHLGDRSAELVELPIMLWASVMVAKWMSRSFKVPHAGTARLAIGAISLGFLLGAELAMVWIVRNQSVREFLFSRDPIRELAYSLSLTDFPLFSLFSGRTCRGRDLSCASVCGQYSEL